jgi:hypothetical protein
MALIESIIDVTVLLNNRRVYPGSNAAVERSNMRLIVTGMVRLCVSTCSMEVELSLDMYQDITIHHQYRRIRRNSF